MREIQRKKKMTEKQTENVSYYAKTNKQQDKENREK